MCPTVISRQSRRRQFSKTTETSVRVSSFVGGYLEPCGRNASGEHRIDHRSDRLAAHHGSSGDLPVRGKYLLQQHGLEGLPCIASVTALAAFAPSCGPRMRLRRVVAQHGGAAVGEAGGCAGLPPCRCALTICDFRRCSARRRALMFLCSDALAGRPHQRRGQAALSHHRRPRRGGPAVLQATAWLVHETRLASTSSI